MIILVDGTSMLHACFFATMPRSYFAAKNPRARFSAMARAMKSPSGVMVNGVYGMVRSLFLLIEKVQPSHMVVAWDISRDTFRKRIYPGYKSNRGLTLPEIKRQILLMQQVLGDLGICQCEADDYEADDVIATLSNMFSDQQVRIYTRDADLLQTVTSSVLVWLHNKKAAQMYEEYCNNCAPLHVPLNVFEYTGDLVKRVYGIMPEHFADLKALSGDRSDNIPGLPGVGTVTAVRLVTAFGSVEQMYELLEPLSYQERVIKFKKNSLPVSLLDKLFESKNINGQQAVNLYKKLALLCTDVPLDVELSQTCLPVWDSFPSIFSELGFNIELPEPERQQVLF